MNGLSLRLAMRQFPRCFFQDVLCHNKMSVERLRTSSMPVYKPGTCCQVRVFTTGFTMQPPVPWLVPIKAALQMFMEGVSVTSAWALIVIFSSGPRAKLCFRNSRFSEQLNTLFWEGKLCFKITSFLVKNVLLFWDLYFMC